MRRRALSVFALAAVASFAGRPITTHAPTREPRPKPATHALVFEENRGRFDARVRYAARRGSRAAFATDDGLTLVSRSRTGGAAVRLRFAGGRAVSPRAESLLGGTINYFLGRDPSRWTIRIPTYAQIRYPDVYPGIDVVYRESSGDLEYDLVVRPGADAQAIELTLDGADMAALTEDGDIDAAVGVHRFVVRRPVTFAADAPERLVASWFVRVGPNRFTLAFAEHDREKTLVVDPVLVWATYVGGTSVDAVDYGSLDVDPAGNVYVSGFTASSDLPATLGAFDTALDGDGDAFVAKLTPSAASLVYCTYLGGSGSDDVKDLVRPVAADASGHAYVTGRTTSPDFPTTPGALSRTFAGGSTDAFVTKLSPAGDALVYSTFLGGDDGDFGYDVLADDAGSAYVAGHTRSSNFPTSADAAGATGTGFVTKLTPAGDALVYSTHFEANLTYVLAIARDDMGNVYAAGQADNGIVPTPGALQEMHRGETYDAFVAKIDPAGKNYLYTTLFGGAGDDTAYALAVDGSGQAIIGGTTKSTDFPTTPGAIRSTLGPPQDAFVTKLNATGTGVVFSTLLGRDGADRVLGLVLDPAGNCYAAGSTGPGLAVKNSCWPEPAADGAGFLTALTSKGELGAFSTFLPSAVVALTGAPNGRLVGLSSPTTELGAAVAGTFDVTHNGRDDAFVFELTPSGSCEPEPAPVDAGQPPTVRPPANDTDAAPTMGSPTSTGDGCSCRVGATRRDGSAWVTALLAAAALTCRSGCRSPRAGSTHRGSPRSRATSPS